MQTEIPLSKRKLIKLLVFSILFLTAGLWMIIFNPQSSNQIINHFLIKGIVAFGGIIMGLLGIYFFGKKLFDQKPGMVLNAEGIYDNSSAFSFGLIPWTDISFIEERSVQASITSTQRFVTIGLLDPGKYIARETNSIKRKLLAANTKHYGSPIQLSTNGLRTKHHSLLTLLKEYFEKYKHN